MTSQLPHGQCRTVRRFGRVCLLFLLLSVRVSAALDWATAPGAGTATGGETLRLELATAGAAAVTSDAIPVTANARRHLTFSYTAENLSTSVRLVSTLRWLDAQDKDVDAQRAQLGFPPVARFWYLTKNSTSPLAVGDNTTVPGSAVRAVLSFRLERSEEGRAARVSVTKIELAEGDVAVTGLDAPRSGPEDAGPLTQPPADAKFGPNLVPNAALEDGADAPTGWRVLGDNRNGAALWPQGGAFSGRHCLKILDRGPYVKSWGEKTDLYLPGGTPGGNYASAREEVSARWASEPVPAVPGAAYQTYAFLWYANRQDLDRGNVNPVRIQFLDQQGRVLPYRNLWQDWLPNATPFEMEGWVPLAGQPVVAPPTAATIRVVVAMFHAFYGIDGGLLGKRSDDRGSVLVDNVALYRVPTQRPLLNKRGDSVLLRADEAYRDTVQASALPFVPTSQGFRPNTLSAESDTGFPGGVLLLERSKEKAAKGNLTLRITNRIGDPREVTIAYEIIDWQGNACHAGTVSAKVPPYGGVQAAIERPPSLPYGAYSIRFTLTENGQLIDRGETRFAVIAKKETAAAERGRMDYPFSLWNHMFRTVIGTDMEREMGLLMDVAGMGKSWFGGNGPIYVGEFVRMKDPAARQAAVAARIAEARTAIAAWRTYGVTPMGHLECPHLLTPEEYPVLAEVVTAFVTALKDDIHQWRYGTESMHGGVKELDLAKMPTAAVNAQGGANYLIWNREGTVRQYWAEYFVAYAAAKKVDPACLFGPQCASDIEGNVLRLFFKVGTKEQLDSFGMNTYIGAFSIWPPNVAELTKNGAPSLPLFVSEFDAQARCRPLGAKVLQEEQDAVRRMVTYWTSVLATFPTFFHLEQWGMILGNDDGSLTYLNRVRPQFVAYAAMTENLGAGVFTARHEIPQGLVYVRERSVRKGPVAVMWSTGPEATAELEVGVSGVTISDVMGNRRPVKAHDGVVEIALTPMPQYLLGARCIRPAKTVKLAFRHATLDPYRPRLALTVTNERPEELAGTLTLLPESGVKLAPAAYPIAGLRNGENRTVYFDVTPVDAGRDKRLAVRARFVTGKRTYEATDALNFHFATQATTPPVIDGDLADWCEDFPLIADRADQFYLFSGTKPWGGPTDLSGRVFLRWDAQNLYVAAHSTDEVFAPSDTPGREFAFDSIELLVDVSRGLRKDAPFQMVTLAAFPDKARVRRYDGSLPKGDVPSARIVVKRIGTETVYEAAIPWKELAAEFTPALGQTISIAFTFDDHDGGDSGRRCLSWFSLVSEKNAADFGDIVLTGSHLPLENLLPNGDFENPALPPGDKMQGWSGWWPANETEKNAEAALVTDGAWQGRSLKITRLLPKSNFTLGGWQVPVKPGQVYLFRAMAKADERNVLVWLTPVDAKGKELPAHTWIRPLSPATDALYSRALSLTVARLAERTGYHPIAGNFEVPEGAVALRVSLAYSWANGAAFFDNCELYLLRDSPER